MIYATVQNLLYLNCENLPCSVIFTSGMDDLLTLDAFQLLIPRHLVTAGSSDSVTVAYSRLQLLWPPYVIGGHYIFAL